MRRFNKIVWSPVEIDYLKENRGKLPLTQLSTALAKSVTAVKNKQLELDGHSVKKTKKRSIGKRKDLGVFCRSGWEANVLRLLNHQNREWLYEPKVFFFQKIKKGTVSYLPDVYLPKEDIYIEIKGMLTSQGRTAINRFKKYYPNEFKKLKAIVGRRGTKADQFFRMIGVPVIHYINELNKEYSDVIPHWE